MQSAAGRWSITTFGITILVSAFLLFQVQPLVSKTILPWFGGCPAVWTTCMLFFQVLLFAGYVYAHLLQQWLSPHRQVAFHLVLVLVAMALLPIKPADSWKPVADANPTWQILLLLSCTVGLPYFALSATSPLVQAWFTGVLPGQSPYRLYALSNVGSLAALLSYPFLFEPAFDLTTQSRLWSGAFILYAILCAATLIVLWRCAFHLPTTENADGVSKRPTWLDRFRWLALPACASLMLLAATNHICQDVAAVPFLWVMPLSLYLLTFIICFEHERWYARRFWAAAVVFSLLAVVVNDFNKANHPLALPWELTLNFAAMFFACMVCHGELARLKPDPRHLTEFYLMISAGGAIGGLFVAIVAPLIFSSYVEWQIGVMASALLAVGVLLLPGRAGRRGIVCYVAISPLIAIALSYFSSRGLDPIPPIDQARNFFGVVSVKKRLTNVAKAQAGGASAATTETIPELLLVHGRIAHGRQFVDPAKRHLATAYFGESSGVGRAIRSLQKAGPIHVGVIGLGVGTLAAYARPNDIFRFYEINPEVERLARKHFTFLGDCRGKSDIVLGDARLSLEAEPPQKFDLLVLDAFSSDSIPVHLLTQEAFKIYLRHLAPNGVIAAHISNNYLRLAPVVRRLAEDRGMQTSRILDPGDESQLRNLSNWVLATRNKAFLKANPSDPVDWGADKCPAPLWTDQYNNLYQVLILKSQ